VSHLSKITGIQLGIKQYLKPFNVLLGIAAARLTACYLISQLVNDNIKRTLLLQWLVKIKLKQYVDRNLIRCRKMLLIHLQTGYTYITDCHVHSDNSKIWTHDTKPGHAMLHHLS